MKYLILALLLVFTLLPAQDKGVMIARTDLVKQLTAQYNLLVERIKAANDEKTRLEAQIGLLQGMKSDSLEVPASWVPEKVETKKEGE